MQVSLETLQGLFSLLSLPYSSQTGDVIVSEMTGNCELHPGALGRHWEIYILSKQIKLNVSGSFYTLKKWIQNKQVEDAQCSFWFRGGGLRLILWMQA